MWRRGNRYNIVVNCACLVMLVGVVIYLATNWSHIPDKIPAHYNSRGEIDRWGNKIELLILPAIGWIMYIGMTVLERFPQLWNTGVTVTAANRDRVYWILRNMLLTMKLLTTAVFVFLAINTAAAKELSVWFLPVFLTLIFGSLAFFIIALFRAR